MFTVLLFATLSLFLAAFVVARRSFAAALFTVGLAMTCLGLIVTTLVAQAKTAVAEYDCRLTVECTSDVILDWCGSGACPSTRQD